MVPTVRTQYALLHYKTNSAPRDQQLGPAIRYALPWNQQLGTERRYNPCAATLQTGESLFEPESAQFQPQEPVVMLGGHNFRDGNDLMLVLSKTTAEVCLNPP